MHERLTRHPVLVLRILHAGATPIPLVGRQVWRGALFMCDALLESAHGPREVPEELAEVIGVLRRRHEVVVEIGSGMGLSSLVACMSLDAGAVYATGM